MCRFDENARLEQILLQSRRRDVRRGDKGSKLLGSEKDRPAPANWSQFLSGRRVAAPVPLEAELGCHESADLLAAGGYASGHGTSKRRRVNRCFASNSSRFLQGVAVQLGIIWSEI